MQVDIRVPPFAPVPEIIAFVQRCEEAGLDGAGFVDSQMILRDVPVVMAAAAMATSRIRLVPAVTNPLTRHVSVLASTARSLDDLAPGRIEVWMGRGFSSLNLVGLPYASVQQMRETILTYKRLLAGERGVFAGTDTYLTDARPIPIFLTAWGPRAIRLGGEVADGVMLAVGLQPEALANARRLVEEGARAAGRDPAGVEIIVASLAVIREDPEEARAWASPVACRRLSDGAWLEAHGIDGRGLQTPRELEELYPDPYHALDWARAIELSAFMPPDLRAAICDATGIVGTPSDCLRKLQEVEEAGFHRVFLMGAGTTVFPENEARLFGDKIGPALRARSLAMDQRRK